jgi:hypothetical protein
VLNVFVFLIVGVGLGSIVVFNRGLFRLEFQRLIFSSFLVLLLSRISFNKKDLHLGLMFFFSMDLRTNIIVIL